MKSLERDSFAIPPTLHVSKDNPYYSSDEYGVLFNKDKTILYFAPAGDAETEMYSRIYHYVVPDTVEVIGDYAFLGYHNGTIANIPESVTTIGNNAFSIGDYNSDISIYLPLSVVSLGENRDYNNISIYFSGTRDQWNQISGHNNYVVKKYEHEHVFISAGCATSHTCEECKVYELKEPTSEHDWKENYRVDATCIEDGYIDYKCQKCGETKREIIASTGVHNWYDSDAYDPTCTEDGSWWRECSVCGKYESGTIPALGHNWSNWFIEQEPTCEMSGSKYRYCGMCDITDHEEIEVLPHQFSSDWTIDEAPTCTSEGSKSHHCIKCESAIVDSTPIEKIPHDYYIKNLVMPLCNKDGSMTHVCIGCGDSYVVVLPSTNTHSDADNDGNCDTCGKQISSGTTTPSEPSKPSTDDCDCMCHKSGFVGFIWKLVKVFYQIFRTNKTCACGAKHY